MAFNKDKPYAIAPKELDEKELDHYVQLIKAEHAKFNSLKYDGGQHMDIILDSHAVLKRDYIRVNKYQRIKQNSYVVGFPTNQLFLSESCSHGTFPKGQRHEYCTINTTKTHNRFKVKLPWTEDTKMDLVRFVHLLALNQRLGLPWPYLFSPQCNKEWEVSHLCHNKWCQTLSHTCLEPKRLNLLRNQCCGSVNQKGVKKVCYCYSKLRCLAAGHKPNKELFFKEIARLTIEGAKRFNGQIDVVEQSSLYDSPDCVFFEGTL